MTSIQSISVGLGRTDYGNNPDATTPTTPRAPEMRHSEEHVPASSAMSPRSAESVPTTPTRHSFTGMDRQRPLPPTAAWRSPSIPTPISPEARQDRSKRQSQQSISSSISEDVDMEQSDAEGDGASDDDTIDSQGGRVSDKKRGQRFFCTEFPPCKLSFTRSEHLARHIRKHTGERPFQCHCSRRFSRLDNLRQHAQTVHVNEDIPVDSLAATGTRFQRQIRTDRVSRPPTSGRARANTAGSQGSQGHRGHARNLSTSSIGSTISTAISCDDSHRRPPPLIMTSETGRPILGLDSLRHHAQTPPAPGPSSSWRESSEGISTPTSTTYSATDQNSPSVGSAVASPVSGMARGSGFWDARAQTRRLSVPSGAGQLQSAPTSHSHSHSHAQSYSSSHGSPYLSPLASSQASTFSPASGYFAGPISGPPEPLTSREAVEAEIRRRTWHPTPHTYTNFSRPGVTASTYTRPTTSALGQYHQNATPDTRWTGPPSAGGPGAHLNTQRLPGIETFDQALSQQQPPTSTPPLPRGPSPMRIDTGLHSAPYRGPSRTGPSGYRSHLSWDMSLHQNLNKLDLAGGRSPSQNSSQGFEQHSQDHGISSQPTSVPSASVSNMSSMPSAPRVHENFHDHHIPTSASPIPESDTHSTQPNRSSKRQGWYAGPPPTSSAQTNSIAINTTKPITSHPRTSPEDSSSSEGIPHTPSMPVIEHHPSIVHSNGYVEGGGPPRDLDASRTTKSYDHVWPLPSIPDNAPVSYTSANRDTEMSGLDVLVAAATREDRSPGVQ